jgi:hemerythrin-like domain-containing protein
MTTADSLPLADPTDMVDLHRVFRAALDRAPALMASAATGDPERVALVADYYANVLRLLHAHHDGEDTLLTPKLVERQPQHAELVRSVAAQHLIVLAALEEAETAIARWRQALDAEPAMRATTALETLRSELTLHLDTEERDVLPLAAECINVVEWGELPSRGLQHFDGDKLWLVVGLIRQEMTAAHLADMDAHLPAPVASMWAKEGQALFGDYIARLFE